VYVKVENLEVSAKSDEIAEEGTSDKGTSVRAVSEKGR
jgi:hypothetical protein